MIIENGPYTVYVLISKTTGKLYVGVTRLEPEKRFNYGSGYIHNTEFYSIIRQYGWKDIKQNIFARNLTKDEAFHMEELLISKFREQSPELICNRDAGGEHGKHCQDTKEILREANVGRIITEEAKVKIRAARANQVFSEEALAKRSAKMKGRKMSPEFCKRLGERSSKAIRCIEAGKEYASMKLAAEDLNLSVSGISQHIKGIYSSVKGYHFEFV